MIFTFSFATITPNLFSLDLITLYNKKKIISIKKKYIKKLLEDRKIATVVMLINMIVDFIIPNIKKVISPTDFDFSTIVAINDAEFSF
tara:strand:- start:43 stop:306 length:264 start_codon:yes stop_codon:yes gene_type:complete